jgi:hypothetical protein
VFRCVLLVQLGPDMNRIERPFGENERRVNRKYRDPAARPATEAQFFADIRAEFAGMQDYMKRQTEKMPEVCRDIVANEGGPTRH